MYLQFFGLKESPFSITPDPRFVFLSERHRDALAHLLYGVGQGGSGGFVQLTGEVGTGKTTLSRLLLEQLPEKCQVALVLNPRLTPTELLETICEELRLDVSALRGNPKGLTDALNAFLLTAYANGERIVLLIDEAQNLSAESLEQIRLLTNLETATQKLLQIILIGQPELRELLDRADLRQLAQRITARFHLTPLDAQETEIYLRHRLAVAGAAHFPFTDSGVRALVRHSQGVPRLINIIADRSLLAGYVREQTRLDRSLVELAVADTRGRKLRWPLQFAAGVAMVLLAVGTLWATLPWKSPARSTSPVIPAGAAAVSPPSRESERNADSDLSGLRKALDALPADASTAAWFALLHAWDVDVQSDGMLDAMHCPNRISPGLNCVRGTGSLGKLRLLDRPALLALHVEQRNFNAVLIKASDQRLVLDLGHQRIEVSPALLDRIWLGEYTIVYRIPPGLPDALRLGAQGDGVQWLVRQLDRHEQRPPAAVPSLNFDSATEARVRELQRSRGLYADGVVGPETALALAAVDGDGPRLGGAL